MEKLEPKSVGDVIRNLLEETSLADRMEELKAASLWPHVIGRNIAELTSKPFVKAGVMSIGVPNAALRNELHLNRSRLRQLINESIGKEIIKEIKFVS